MPAGNQHDWKWCSKCQGLVFAGNPSAGACPAGGDHTHVGSADYSIADDGIVTSTSQGNWRWCKKCQGLAYAGSPSPGPCPAGGTHNHAGSFDYILFRDAV